MIRALRRRLLRHRIWVLEEDADPESPYSLAPYDEHRCIFFHIPKTAGISITEALFGCRGAGHIDVREARRIFGRLAFARYFKFTFVRNPYDRLVSAYTYLRDGAIAGRMSPFIRTYIEPYPEFRSFVRDGLRDVLFDQHFRPQSSWVCDREGLRVDFVGRFERLSEDFATVAARLGIPASLGHRNRSRREREYRSYYEEDTRRLASDVYAEDLERFEYDF